MTEQDLQAGQDAVRRMLDASGYGRWVSDDQCRACAASVIHAVDAERAIKAAAK